MEDEISVSVSSAEFYHSKLVALREIKAKNERLQRQIRKSLESVEAEYREVLEQIDRMHQNESNKRKLEVEFLKYTNPRENQSTLLYFLKNFTGGRNDLMPYEIENVDQSSSETDLEQQIKDFLGGNKPSSDSRALSFAPLKSSAISGAAPDNPASQARLSPFRDARGVRPRHAQEASHGGDIKEEDFADFENEPASKKDLEIKEEFEFSHHQTSEIKYTNFNFEETLKEEVKKEKEIQLSVEDSDLEDPSEPKQSLVDKLEVLGKREHGLFDEPLRVYPGGELTR